jgi:hypothetical protein
VTRRRFVAESHSAPKDDETFDEHLIRKGHAPKPFVDPYAGLTGIERYRQEAKDSVAHYRERCRETLADPERFEHLETLIDGLGVLRREALVTTNLIFRPIERLRSLAETWLYLQVGIAMKKGHTSPWSDDRDQAVAGIAEATSNLERTFTKYLAPTLVRDAGPIRDSLDTLRQVHGRLVKLFPPQPRKKPVSHWRHQTVSLLRYECGLRRFEAEELVRAAGLNTAYPEERRPRTRKQLPTRKSHR